MQKEIENVRVRTGSQFYVLMSMAYSKERQGGKMREQVGEGKKPERGELLENNCVEFSNLKQNYK